MSEHPTTEKAVNMLRPFWEKRCRALEHLREMARLCEELAQAEGLCELGISNLTADHMIEPTKLMIDALFSDIEVVVRVRLDDRDFHDGPVATAHQTLRNDGAPKG